MSLMIQPEPVPLEADRDGVIRVAGTRVTLEAIVAVFAQGATSEEIAQQYPAVPLAEVYAVIGYYLRHRDEVEQYVVERRNRFEKVRKEVESALGPDRIRERLLARRAPNQ